MHLPTFVSLGTLLLSASLAAGQGPAAAPTLLPSAGGCCPSCEQACDAPAGGRLTVEAGVLRWKLKDAPLPVPLITLGSVVNTGTLGFADTTVLRGAQSVDFGTFDGTRLLVGYRFGDNVGLEVSGFRLEQRSSGFFVASDAVGNPVLARPAFSLFRPDFTAGEDRLLVSFPAILAGGVGDRETSQLRGAEINLTHNVQGDGPVRLQLLGGVRYLSLREDVAVASQSFVEPTFGPFFLFLGNPEPVTSTFVVFDSFVTHNHFVGGQAGLKASYESGRFDVTSTAKLALGVSRQQVDINGASTLIRPDGSTTTAPGGVFAQPSNIGRYEREEFAFVPEIGVDVGLWLTRNVRLSLGYSLLYWSRVARPGDQINRVVNPTQAPVSERFGFASGQPLQPIPLFSSTDFWAHGVNAALTLRF